MTVRGFVVAVQIVALALVVLVCGLVLSSCTASDQSAFKAGLQEVLRVAVAVCKPVVAVGRAADAAGLSTSGGEEYAGPEEVIDDADEVEP